MCILPPLLFATFGEHVGLAVFHPLLPEILFTEEYTSGPQLRIHKNTTVVNTIKRECKLTYRRLEEKYTGKHHD